MIIDMFWFATWLNNQYIPEKRRGRDLGQGIGNKIFTVHAVFHFHLRFSERCEESILCNASSTTPTIVG